MTNEGVLPVTWQCSDEWTVIRAKKDDAHEITSLCNACHHLHSVDENFILREKEFFEDSIESSVHRENEKLYRSFSYCLKHNDEGALLGYFQCIADYPESGTMWINAMIINPHYQGKGIGREFIQSFEQKIYSDVIKNLSLRVSLKNYPALRFWIANGFTSINRFQGEEFCTAENNGACFVLSKKLPHSFIHVL